MLQKTYIRTVAVEYVPGYRDQEVVGVGAVSSFCGVVSTGTFTEAKADKVVLSARWAPLRCSRSAKPALNPVALPPAPSAGPGLPKGTTRYPQSKVRVACVGA
jgi:hypothetical protein